MLEQLKLKFGDNFLMTKNWIIFGANTLSVVVSCLIWSPHNHKVSVFVEPHSKIVKKTMPIIHFFLEKVEMKVEIIHFFLEIVETAQIPKKAEIAAKLKVGNEKCSFQLSHQKS